MECEGGCPFQETLDILGRRNALTVIWALQGGDAQRFNDLKRTLGINPVTLCQRLRDLECAGVVAREEFESPQRVEYRLTEKGLDLIPLIEGLETWSKRHATVTA